MEPNTSNFAPDAENNNDEGEKNRQTKIANFKNKFI